MKYIAIKPKQLNAICLNKKNSVFPEYLLYAICDAALYTTRIDTSESKITIPQINLSPRAFDTTASPTPVMVGVSDDGLNISNIFFKMD